MSKNLDVMNKVSNMTSHKSRHYYVTAISKYVSKYLTLGLKDDKYMIQLFYEMYFVCFSTCHVMYGDVQVQIIIENIYIALFHIAQNALTLIITPIHQVSI